MPDVQPQYYKGKDLFLILNGVMIGCDQSTDIELTVKTFDNTSKCTVDSAGNLFGSAIATMVTAKFSGSGFTVLDQSASGGPAEFSTATLMNLAISTTKCFASWIRGDDFYGCDVYVESIKETAKFDEISSYTYSLASAGPITRSNPS